MNNITIAIIVVLVTAVIIAPLGFFAGLKYQQNQRQVMFGQGLNRMFNGQLRQGVAGARSGMSAVNGEITAIDDKSITVKSADGQGHIIFYSDSTNINKTNSANKSDLKVGDKVLVFGSLNTDKTVSAQNIQLNPQTSGGR